MSLTKELDFSPMKSWSPHLPKVVWQGLALTPSIGAGNLDNSVWNLSSLSLAQALKTVHENLEFTESLRLLHELKNLGHEEHLGEVASSYNLPQTSDVQKLCGIFVELPKVFQLWCDEKKLKFSDLRPLLRANVETLKPGLFKIVEVNASKNQGTEILELLVDFETATPSLATNASAWLSELQALARPKASELDRQNSEQIQRWAWPIETKGVWKRNGDQTGLSIQIETHSPEDLEKKLNQLQVICKEWKAHS